jgi:hypothetical protein
MKLLLSCFGLGCDTFRAAEVYGKGINGRGKYYSEDGYYSWDPFWEYESPPFFSMPAISLQTVGPGFIPDYPVFLLFDEFVIDEKTYHLLSKREHWGYNEYADLVQTLYEAGRLTIESYESLLEPYKDVVKEAVEYDLGMLRSWHREFEELASRWKKFANIASREITQRIGTREPTKEEDAILFCIQYSELGMVPTPDGLLILDALKSWNKALDPIIRKRTRFITGDYFRYVTSNILLSNITGAIAHEWFDLEPLYLRKLSVGGHPEPDAVGEMKQARKLFEIMFSEFHPKDSASFVNLLEDSRVESLRTLLRRATLGEEEFDSEFATRTYREVLKVEHAIAAKRNLVGWLSQPLGFIPWVGSFLQKATEVASGRMIEARFKKDMDWFFLISSVEERKGRH